MISDSQQTIIKDHALVDSDRWELSDIFYNLRLILDDRGYNTKLRAPTNLKDRTNHFVLSGHGPNLEEFGNEQFGVRNPSMLHL